MRTGGTVWILGLGSESVAVIGGLCVCVREYASWVSPGKLPLGRVHISFLSLEGRAGIGRALCGRCSGSTPEEHLLGGAGLAGVREGGSSSESS